MIIGLTGPAGSGKSHAASYFETGFGGYNLESLASGLKLASGPLFNLGHNQLYGSQKETKDKYGFTPRSRLQALGDHCKSLYGDSFFVDMLLERISNKAHNEKVIIDDVRFLCEAEAVRAAGGIVIGIRRPLVFNYTLEEANAGTAHQSEAEMVSNWEEMCDFELCNDIEGATLDNLRGRETDKDLHANMVAILPLIKYYERNFGQTAKVEMSPEELELLSRFSL